MIDQSHRALEYLHPDNLPFRASAVFELGHAYLLQGDRAGARQAFAEVTAMGTASGNTSDETMGSVLRWATARHWTISSFWRPGPSGTPWSWQPAWGLPVPAKPTWAWPVCSTSGTTSMPPDSTGNRVSNWHDRR